MTVVEFDPSNAEQARAWNGDEGRYWADHADRFDRAVRPHHERFMAAAAIEEAGRVLDIGCGNGETTRAAARAATKGHALGVDLSAAMLEVARQRAAAERLDNVEFLQADVQIHQFEPGGSDVAIGRCSTMFFGDRAAAFANIARALRPGGRLTLMTWQGPDRVTWFRDVLGALLVGRPAPAPPPDAPGPFSLSDPDRVRELLEGAGFTDVAFVSSEAPMCFGDDVEDAMGFLLGLLHWLVADLDEQRWAQATDALRATLTAHHSDAGVCYDSAAWIVTARRA